VTPVTSGERGNRAAGRDPSIAAGRPVRRWRQRMNIPDSVRAMTSRWISLVPSKMV